jgi:short-subunit dehydrogenase
MAISQQERPLEPVLKAIIVGASSGIGAALAIEMGQAGYRLALVARREEKLAEVADAVNQNGPGEAAIYPQDVTDYESTPALFQDITRTLGGLDVIVYVAGVMPQVASNEYTFSKDRSMIEVNVLGAMAWLNLAADRFQKAGSGQIVGIGSVAGDRGRRPQPAYHTSKAALHTYLESLRNRLSQHGIAVTTIKPGQVETRMLEDVDSPIWPVSPEKAAAIIMKTVRDKKGGTVYIPARWQLVSWVIRLMPSFIFRRLNF